MRIVVHLTALVTLAASLAAQTLTEIETKLGVESPISADSDLRPGRRLLIRGFYSDMKIAYSDQGRALGAQVGSWLGDGYIEVESLTETDGGLLVVAKRLHGYFDKKQILRFRDAKEKVTLTFPTKAALPAIFFSGNEELVATLPLIWRRFLTGASAYSEQPPQYKPAKGMQAPRPIYNPEPARPPHNPKFKGVASMVCLVDADGAVRNIEIQRPLGSGLDEKAAEAISRWRFEPAAQDKKPVPVRIQIDVDFHLY